MKSNKLRVGIVGSKFAANLHAKAYERCNNVEISAVASIDGLEEFANTYNIKSKYSDYNMMFKSEKLDLISVCVPNFLHKEVTIAAAKAGIKAIICEKPIATTLEDAKEMIEVCNKNKVKLMYAEDWIFAPALKRAESIYNEGAIGDALFLKAKETHSGSHSPFAQKIKTCGGGAMIHLGIHPIGWVRWFKKKEVKEVIGRVSGGKENNLKHKNFEGEDWSAAILTFSDNTHAIVEGNYITCGGLDDMIEIYGTKGVIKVKLSLGSPISVFSLDGYSYAVEKAETTVGWTRPAVDEEAELGYEKEIKYFVDCVLNDKEPIFGVRGEDGLKALEIVSAIYKSAREGKLVSLK